MFDGVKFRKVLKINYLSPFFYDCVLPFFNFQFLASMAKWRLFTSSSQFETLLRLVCLLLIELAKE